MAANMSTTSTKKLLEFMITIGRLKGLKRTGWVLRGVPDAESVASHMYRMAVLALFTDSQTAPSIKRDRCIKMALVHDLAECIVGDITPSDGISKEEKHKQEKLAMEHLCSLVPGEVSKEIFSLWEEYETQSSQEATFVKDLDKFDMILQAYEYEQSQNKPNSLQEFFDSTDEWLYGIQNIWRDAFGKFQNDQVKDWVQQLAEMRSSKSENSSS